MLKNTFSDTKHRYLQTSDGRDYAHYDRDLSFDSLSFIIRILRVGGVFLQLISDESPIPDSTRSRPQKQSYRRMNMVERCDHEKVVPNYRNYSIDNKFKDRYFSKVVQVKFTHSSAFQAPSNTI